MKYVGHSSIQGNLGPWVWLEEAQGICMEPTKPSRIDPPGCLRPGSKGQRTWEQAASRTCHIWGDWLLLTSAQSCPTLCNPMDCSPSGSAVHGIFLGKNIGVGCHFLLPGMFLTQGLNPCLLHCRWIFYRMSHQGSYVCKNPGSWKFSLRYTSYLGTSTMQILPVFLHPEVSSSACTEGGSPLRWVTTVADAWCL